MDWGSGELLDKEGKQCMLTFRTLNRQREEKARDLDLKTVLQVQEELETAITLPKPKVNRFFLLK